MLQPPLQYLKMGHEAHFSRLFIEPTRILLNPSDWNVQHALLTGMDFQVISDLGEETVPMPVRPERPWPDCATWGIRSIC